MRGRSALAVVTVSALVLLGVGGLLSAQAAHPRGQRRSHLDRRSPSHPVAHVLMISVDGLHESDLEWYMRAHPGSALAKLARGGTRYANARASVPSDAYAGTVAALTGGESGVSGIYSGLGYDHDVLVPGSTSCAAGTPRGARVDFGSSIDRDPASIDAGQGLAGLPRTILQMTGSPHRLIDPARLPVDPRTCRPLYPHQDLRVNTVFEVARDHEMRTAWSDQHPSYEILDGPSGRGVQDLFTPEISSQAIGYPAGQDWTDDAAATMRYDSFKLHAVLREVAGYDHGGVRRVGVPALFGLSLQAVSVAQQRQSSDGLSGGYRPGTEVPGPLLRRALDYLDTSIATIVHELSIRRLTASTAIVLSAAHGQSPQDPNDLTRIDDAPIIAAINAAWTASHPHTGPLVAAATDSDALALWLSDHSEDAAIFVESYLLTHAATGTTISGAARTLAGSGLAKVYAGLASADYFGTRPGDPRHPDVWGLVRHGVVFSTATSAIAAHGGADPQDRDVPLVVYAPGRIAAGVTRRPVQSIQIAPTILRLLGLDPLALQAVRVAGTRVLPGTG